MGNRRSVEKALSSASAPTRALTADHDVLRARRRARAARRRRVPAAMRRLRDAGLDELIARARRARACRCFGPCLGMQLLFEGSEEHGGAEGLGPARAARCGALDAAPALKLPHIGWNEVRFTRRVAAADGPARPVGLLPRALLRRRTPPTRTTCSASATTASAFASVVARGNVFGAPVPPREVLARPGCALLRELRALCAPVRRRDPLPGDRHPRGQGRAAVQGDFDAKTVYDDVPLEAARAWVEAGRALPARRRPRRRADGHAAEPRPPRADRPRAGRPGPVRRRPALAAAPCATRCAPAPSGSSSARRPSPTSTSSTTCSAPSASASSSRVDTRGGNVSTVGLAETTQMPADAVIERLQQRGVRSFVYTNVDRDGMLEGPDLDEVRRIAAVVRGRFLYSGGIGTLDDLAGARRAAPGQPRRRDRRQGALRAALHGRARRQRALRRLAAATCACTSSA